MQGSDQSVNGLADSSYRIRRTFIDIEDPAIAEASATPLRRVSSDPAVVCLTRLALQVEGDDEEDEETCSTSSTSPSREVGQLARSELCQVNLEHQRSQPSRDSSSVASSASATNHADLLAENARLAEENKLLRENMRLVAENRSLVAAVADKSSKRSSKPCAAKLVTRRERLPTRTAPSERAASSDAAVPFPAGKVTLTADDAVPSSVEAQSTDTEIDTRTTVMWRNLPNNYTRAMLLKLLDDSGFSGLYDFVYMPIDFKTHASLGYAFINLTHASVVAKFWRKFDGYSRWAIPSKKASHVSWSDPHQGFTVNVDRYRNSPVMHDSVPDEYKPVVFVNGARMCFPPPTKKPRAPRYRQY